MKQAPEQMDIQEQTDARRRVFRSLCEELSEFIRDNGIEAVPYEKPDLGFFMALDQASQIRVIDEISSYLRLCREAMADGECLNSSPQLTWRAIRDAGLVPPSDLFTLIKATDIVEIYDLSNLQTFRNFKFFQFCSYTIEDLYTRPWPTLFRRLDSAMTDEIIDLISRLVESKDKRIHATGQGAQLIEEVGSVRRYVNELNVKYLGILYDRHDSPKTFIVIEDARRIARV